MADLDGGLRWRPDADWEGDYRLFAGPRPTQWIASHGEVILSQLPGVVDVSSEKAQESFELFCANQPASPVGLNPHDEMGQPIAMGATASEDTENTDQAPSSDTPEAYDHTGIDPDDDFFLFEPDEATQRQMRKDARRRERERREALGEVTPRSVLIRRWILIALLVLAVGVGVMWRKGMFHHATNPGIPFIVTRHAPVVHGGMLTDEPEHKKATADLSAALSRADATGRKVSVHPELASAASALSRVVGRCRPLVEAHTNSTTPTKDVRACADEVNRVTGDANKAVAAADKKAKADKAKKDKQAKAKADKDRKAAEAAKKKAEESKPKPAPAKPTADKPAPKPKPAPHRPAPAKPKPKPAPKPHRKPHRSSGGGGSGRTYSQSASCPYGGTVTFSSSGHVHVSSSGSVSGNSASSSESFSASATSDAPIITSRSGACA